MNNQKIRRAVEVSGVPLWRVAKRQGVNIATLSRWMREEMPPEKQAAILKDIEAIAAERQEELKEVLRHE